MNGNLYEVVANILCSIELNRINNIDVIIL